MSLLCGPLYLFIFLFFWCVCWRTRRQQIDPAAHRWRRVSRAWVVQASGRHVSLCPPEVCPNNSRALPLFFSLCGHILIINLSKAVCDTEHKRPHLKTLCEATIKKRKRHLHLSHILSFVLIFPVDPVTCYFPLKQRFEIECSQTFCVDRIHKRLYSDRVQPSTSYFPVLTVDIS